MSIESWGPKIWSILHICSFMYPDNPTHDDKIKMHNFVHSLSFVLPCPKCRKHFQENIQTHMAHPDAVALQSKRDFSQYVVKVHNEVNIRNGKDAWSYEQAERHYCGDTVEICSMQRAALTESPPTPTHSASSRGPIICALVILFVSVLCCALTTRLTQKNGAGRTS